MPNLNGTVQARVEEAYSALEVTLRDVRDRQQHKLARRARRHLRSALCDLILLQEMKRQVPLAAERA